jgi:serine/threonine-protein kinase
MNAKVISIGNTGQNATAESTSLARIVDGTGIERVRRALGNSVDVIKPLDLNSRVERYLARDTRGRAFQLNVLAPCDASDVKTRERFYLEAESASKLMHMNILGSSDAKGVNGVDFYVVQHKQQALPLGQLINRNGWLDVKEAARIADQIASALGYAHQIGVLHLSLQPDCLLVEPDGWVIVGDFGVDAERAAPRLQGHNARYASPELAMGKLVDHRSDLYSLGAILYEMLTDRTLFDSDDPDYVRRKQISFTPSPPHLISMDVPEAVSNVVMKLLERDRANRFANAAAFQAALDDAVS